jgi:hypothetical protein
VLYRIGDTDSANLVAECIAAEDAIAAIRRAVGAYGPAALEHWALESQDDDGRITVLAEGDALVRVAVEGSLV